MQINLFDKTEDNLSTNSNDLYTLLANVYIHERTGLRLKIKKIYGGVVVCYSEEDKVVFKSPLLKSNIHICSIKSLILEKTCCSCEAKGAIEMLTFCPECSGYSGHVDNDR